MGRIRMHIVLTGCLGTMAAAAMAADPSPPADLPACQRLPGDVSLVLSFRPSALVGTKLERVVKSLDQFFKPSFHFTLAEAESLSLVIVGPLVSGEPGNGYFWHIRARGEPDWSKLTEQTQGQWTTEVREGRTIRSMGEDDERRFIWLPDKRSVVYADEIGLVRALEVRDANDNLEFDEAWTLARKQPLALFFDIKSLRSFDIGVAEELGRTEYLPIERLAIDGKQLIVVGQPSGEGLKLQATLTTNSEEGAARAVTASATLLRDFAAHYVQMIDTSGNSNTQGLDQVWALLREPTTKGLVQAAAGLQFRTEGTAVHAETSADAEAFELFCVATMIWHLTDMDTP